MGKKRRIINSGKFTGKHSGHPANVTVVDLSADTNTVVSVSAEKSPGITVTETVATPVVEKTINTAIKGVLKKAKGTKKKTSQ